ncbi:MAG: hypothetical protein IJK62_14620 [Bacteroidales bacterium]|nr:hypothetical protein [Bacteroidales bacterium]
MKRLISTIIIAACTLCAFAQSINISFTGKTIRGRHVDMDSIWINNLTQGWTATLVAPDTSCSFDLTAIKINSVMSAELSQNVPNPFHGTTEVSLSLPKPDKVGLQVHDIGGRLFADYNGRLPEGEHRFEISLASPQSYLLSANTSDGTSSIKMVNLGSGGTNSITYIGQVAGKTLRDGDYDLAIGDALECTGYTTYCDSIYESELYSTTITDGSDTECQLRFNLRSGGTVDEVTACDFYQWINRFIYTESTDTATCTLTNSMGCDSVVTLHLTINHSYGEGRRITACDFYEYDGTTYTESGMSTHRFSTVEGCDSTIYLYLTIEHPETHEIDSTVCDSYEWEGQTYTEDRTFSTTYENQYGCDSTLVVTFHVNHSTETIDTREECDSFIWIDGNTYTESNSEATYTYIAENGCDSVLRLNLTITRIEHEFYASACEEYGWDGDGYIATGDYTKTYTAANGCDSIVTLHFTKLGNLIRESVHVCDDDSYTWINGRTYTIEDLLPYHSHIFDEYTYTNSYGCDSTIYLYLFFNTDEVVDTHRACDSFTWIDGVTYTESNNTATVTLTNQYGCDSVVHLNLTIGHSDNTVHEVTAEECSYYRMSNGEYFTESGDYQRTLQSSCGCDSIVLLHLTITGEDGIEGTFYDERDGITYRTIQYGCQTWFAEDLRTNYYADGTQIGTPPSNSGYVFYYYRYSNHGGYFYGPNIAHSHGSVCPTGWHIPTRTEWEDLFTMLRIRDEYICGNDSSILKAISNTTGWNSSDVECSPGYDMATNNSSNLGLNPDGAAWICPQEKSVLNGIGEYANYLTSSNDVIIFFKNYINPRCYMDYQSPGWGILVRCVMNY